MINPSGNIFCLMEVELPRCNHFEQLPQVKMQIMSREALNYNLKRSWTSTYDRPSLCDKKVLPAFIYFSYF